MSVVLEATRAAMVADLRPETTVALAENVTDWLKPLIARVSAVIRAKPISVACLSQSPMD
ncbi:MAG TPA: hypothetical protein VI358_17495 [Pseudolabrys sp.]